MALRVPAELTELETVPLGFDTTVLVSQPDRRRLRVNEHRVVYVDRPHRLMSGGNPSVRSTV